MAAIWSICTKMIDGTEQIVRGGRNLVITENYHRTLVVDEIVARQIKKLEIVDGELHITEPLLSVEELNRIRDEQDTLGQELAAADEQPIVTPVNMEVQDGAQL